MLQTFQNFLVNCVGMAVWLGHCYHSKKLSFSIMDRILFSKFYILSKFTYLKEGNKKPYLFSEKIVVEIDNVRLVHKSIYSQEIK